MFAYFRDIWKCRYFWLSLVQLDLRSRYRGSVLGMGWSLLQPVAMTIILTFVFYKLFSLSIEVFAPYLMTGLAFWGFLASVTVQGCYSFRISQGYILQFPAPMAIYPLRTMLGGGFHFLLALAMAILLAAVVGSLPNPLALWALLPALLLLAAFGWALALLFGLAAIRFRDTHHLAEISLQGLFYLTPVIYGREMVEARGLGPLMAVNPLVPFLHLLRTPILEGAVPDATVWASAVMVVLAAGGAAVWAMHAQERRLIFHL